MNFSEFQKRAAPLPEAEGAEMRIATAWLRPEHIRLGVASLKNAGQKTVKIPGKAESPRGGKKPVIAIAREAFSGNDAAEEVILPPSIQRICAGAFDGCKKLRRITIPKVVSEIRQGTFRGCEALEDVYYEGTTEEWEKIRIVHRKHEIEFGDLFSGAVAEITAERWVPIPGNEALFTATIHFRCDLASLYPNS